MKNKAIALLVLGLFLLGVGALMQLHSGAPAADASIQARCRAEMKARGANAELSAHCTEAAFAAAMTATDANAAARSISAANTSEVGSNALSMFFIGLGLVLALGGGLMLRNRPVQ